MPRKKEEHYGELDAKSKQMLVGEYQFVEEDMFWCVCGAKIFVHWDEYKKEYVPRLHAVTPPSKPYNSGKRCRK
jgi:hypothetical protein